MDRTELIRDARRATLTFLPNALQYSFHSGAMRFAALPSSGKPIASDIEAMRRQYMRQWRVRPPAMRGPGIDCMSRVK
jgi:hypothetical protein